MPSHIIYARKSTESADRQVLSIDSQVNELQTLAARRGIRVAEVLTESKSAKAPGRPVFQGLLKRINRGQIRGVICWKMDRLARNHLDTGAILQALADGRIEEVITSDRTYTSDGNDRFMGNFELGMATKYIDDLRANVRRGNRARFQRGWINYLPPMRS
ncbi:MAG: recombinase family protein, partial [Candidatus Eisenbacteria bacterium]|nr:recombinase family protein [Candidatus Eisenbacteria bacterium]